jgi:hypothetical protein
MNAANGNTRDCHICNATGILSSDVYVNLSESKENVNEVYRLALEYLAKLETIGQTEDIRACAAMSRGDLAQFIAEANEACRAGIQA